MKTCVHIYLGDENVLLDIFCGVQYTGWFHQLIKYFSPIPTETKAKDILYY